MASCSPHVFLLASQDPALLAEIEPILQSTGASVEIALSAGNALTSITGSDLPSLALIDADLPGMPVGQLLAAVRAQGEDPHLPIILIAGSVTREQMELLANGVIDDLIPRSSEPAYWKLRLDLVLRNRRMAEELETLRDAAIRNAQFDRLTGVYNRETMLSMLFRETDRAQRMNSPISLTMFDIDDFGHWNSRLGVDACDELLCQVANRTGLLLRSYDLLGRPGMDEFLVALPACCTANAVTLAERLRAEVFAAPFHVVGEVIRLSACFGIASSHGRSPVVVMREAEIALGQAKTAGPETIQCYGGSPQCVPPAVTYLSADSGDELLAW